MSEPLYRFNYDRVLIFDDHISVPSKHGLRIPLRDVDATLIELPGDRYNLNISGIGNAKNKYFEIVAGKGADGKEKLIEARDFINCNNSAPVDMPPITNEQLEKEENEKKNKRMLILVVFLIAAILAIPFNMCSNHKSTSNWDNLNSHQQEVAREAHDYKEALDGMK